MNEKKIHNAKLWTTFILMWGVYLTSVWGLVDSPTWKEVVFCSVSVIWLCLFGFANFERCKGE